MLERARAAAAFPLALMVGSTIGGVAVMAKYSASFAEFADRLSLLNVLMMGVMGSLFGFLPYCVIAIPACLALERNIPNSMTRTTVLTIGGTGVGAGVSAITIDIVIYWATFVGGFTGLTLGLLRSSTFQLKTKAVVLP